MIAFLKTAKGTGLMTDSPGTVEPKQLRDLHLELKVKQPVATPSPAPKAMWQVVGFKSPCQKPVAAKLLLN